MLLICRHLEKVIEVMREQQVELYLPISKLECKRCDYRWNGRIAD